MNLPPWLSIPSCSPLLDASPTSLSIPTSFQENKRKQKREYVQERANESIPHSHTPHYTKQNTKPVYTHISLTGS